MKPKKSASRRRGRATPARKSTRKLALAPSPSARRALGLGGADLLKLRASVTSLPGTAARGEGLASQPLEHFLSNLSLTQVALPAQERLSVRRHDEDPAILFVESQAEALGSAGPVRTLGEGAWVLDSRCDAAWLRLALPAGDTVIGGRRGALLLLEVSGDRPLDLDRVLGGEPTAPWLLRSASSLASSREGVDQLAAAGLVARLYKPARAGPDALARALRGDTPAHRAASWAKGLGPQALKDGEAGALRRAAALQAALEPLTAGETPGTAFRRALAGWVQRRDDLESVVRLLEAAGRGGRLRKALTSLDQRAWTHLTALTRHGALEDERLRELSWRHPDLWWSGLGRG